MIRKIDVTGLPDPIVHAIESLVDTFRREASSMIKSSRPIGWMQGKWDISKSFFDPLPDDVLDTFEGNTSDETAP